MIDLHCHILPGLDDGPESLEDAIEMARIAVEDGIDTIVATPHVLNGIHHVSRDEIFQTLRCLQEELDNRNLPLKLLPGSDVYVDKRLPELLDKGKIVTVADKGKHVMLELPNDTVPQEISELLFKIQLRGVTPILTHPERNSQIQQNTAVLEAFIDTGNLTQITAGSLTGDFGSRIRECAYRLVRERMAHLVATDAHSPGRRPPRIARARSIIGEEMGEKEARVVFEERPRMILEGMFLEPPEPVYEPRKSGRRFWHRWSAFGSRRMARQ